MNLLMTRAECVMQQQDFLDAAADMSNLQYGAGPEHSHQQQTTMQLRSDTAQNGAMQPLSDIVQSCAFSQSATLAQQAGTFACVVGLPTQTRHACRRFVLILLVLLTRSCDIQRHMYVPSCELCIP